eukprot:TRINITY_DN15002_c0_g1_i1.p1 TRINITY_DN15002_c0_g1~~TRINITY_DN15002_c0_g1_i1.p1  ORF type:complete len:373 (-),score=136.12 TRINITY_DN15002_c0_g1_i1:42-1160(-)
MIKARQVNIAETNIANLGSELEKNVREAAANKEPAWEKAGQAVGLQIWRIEKFRVKSVPKPDYGSFYTGDSYIVLNTYKKPNTNALLWDVHFWLGTATTQDEAGTAAYKTVELDDKLGGAPIQHREVQGYESALFLSYFKNQIRILEGGVDSGFNHVKPEEYKPRLLHLKGKKRVRVTQVPMSHDSLNSGDVFILDTGMVLYQWNGSKAGPQEKMKGAQLSRAIDDERRGLPKVVVLEESHTGEDQDPFWALLGGRPARIRSAEEGGSDVDAEKSDIKRLFQLSDASGAMKFTKVGEGSTVKKSLLDPNDVFVLDTGAEVYVWIGKGASADEKKNAMKYAQDYLTQFNRPPYISITRILDGGENEVWRHTLA